MHDLVRFTLIGALACLVSGCQFCGDITVEDAADATMPRDQGGSSADMKGTAPDRGHLDQGRADQGRLDQGMNQIDLDACQEDCELANACIKLGDAHPTRPCLRCDFKSNGSIGWITDANACFINSECYAANESNPVEMCRVCTPSKNQLNWNVKPQQCYIESACVAGNETHPSESCRACIPDKNPLRWSVVGGTCYIDNACQMNGEAHPTDTCRVCLADKNQLKWSVKSTTCYIDGQCLEEGARDPADACNICTPSRSTIAWTREDPC